MKLLTIPNMISTITVSFVFIFSEVFCVPYYYDHYNYYDSYER